MNSQELRNYENEIRKYWDKCRDDREYSQIEQLNKYIDRFLPCELAHARELAHSVGEERLPEQGRDVLILLVGYSLEPLLQSICAWRPKEVLLVLNKGYGNNTGSVWGKIIEELTERIVKNSQRTNDKNLLDKIPYFRQVLLRNKSKEDTPKLKEDTPKAVFKKLRTGVLALLDKHLPSQIMLDITGGKKSMVAGAYLFGAYANVDISYVDFEDSAYQPEYGKPYGYACKIGILENPYEKFALRDWQRVEELYERHAFRSAREKVEELIKGMHDLFEPQEIEAANTLKQVLQIYEEWERGDYHQACESAEKIPSFPSPILIEIMAKNSPAWPNAKSSEEEFNKQASKLEKGEDCQFKNSLYTQDRLKIYANDELEKIRIFLKNSDYRTAFVRAYSLSEVLLKARFINQLVKGLIEFEKNNISKGFDSLDSKDKETWAKDISRIPTFEVLDILARQNSIKKLNKTNLKYTGNKTLEENLIKRFNRFRIIRNKLAHFCFWVPEHIARDCIDWTADNLNDFEENWMPAGQANEVAMDKNIITPMDWEKELKPFCKIKFLPPSSRKMP